MKKRNKKISTANFNDPQKGFDSTSKRIVFFAIILIIAVMIGTFFYVTYKYGSFSNMFLGETTEATTEEQTEKREIKNVDGKKNYLFAVTSPGESEIYNIFMVGVNMTENKAAVVSVPIYTKDSSERTLEEEFKLGGVSQIEYVLERMFGIDFDYRLCATQNGFKFFLTELGKGVKFNVPEDLQFSTTNYTVSLTKGNQELSFDNFVKLMRYEEWGSKPSDSFKMQGELIKALFEQYATLKNVTRDVDKFTYRMTHIKSNISSEDYVNDLDALEYIAAKNFEISVISPDGNYSGSGKNRSFKMSAGTVKIIGESFNPTVAESE